MVSPTENSVCRVIQAVSDETDLLQVTEIRKRQLQDYNKIARQYIIIRLSDGKLMVDCLLSPSLYHLIECHDVKKYSYITNVRCVLQPRKMYGPLVGEHQSTGNIPVLMTMNKYKSDNKVYGKPNLVKVIPTKEEEEREELKLANSKASIAAYKQAKQKQDLAIKALFVLYSHPTKDKLFLGRVIETLKHAVIVHVHMLTEKKKCLPYWQVDKSEDNNSKGSKLIPLTYVVPHSRVVTLPGFFLNKDQTLDITFEQQQQQKKQSSSSSSINKTNRFGLTSSAMYVHINKSTGKPQKSSKILEKNKNSNPHRVSRVLSVQPSSNNNNHNNYNGSNEINLQQSSLQNKNNNTKSLSSRTNKNTRTTTQKKKKIVHEYSDASSEEEENDISSSSSEEEFSSESEESVEEESDDNDEDIPRRRTTSSSSARKNTKKYDRIKTKLQEKDDEEISSRERFQLKKKEKIENIKKQIDLTSGEEVFTSMHGSAYCGYILPMKKGQKVPKGCSQFVLNGSRFCMVHQPKNKDNVNVPKDNDNINHDKKKVFQQHVFEELSIFDLKRPKRLPLINRVTLPVSELRSELECVICLCLISNATCVRECMHRFCESCIKSSLRMGQKKCPVCQVTCPSQRYLRLDRNMNSVLKLIRPGFNKATAELEEPKIEKNIISNLVAVGRRQQNIQKSKSHKLVDVSSPSSSQLSYEQQHTGSNTPTSRSSSIKDSSDDRIEKKQRLSSSSSSSDEKGKKHSTSSSSPTTTLPVKRKAMTSPLADRTVVTKKQKQSVLTEKIGFMLTGAKLSLPPCFLRVPLQCTFDSLRKLVLHKLGMSEEDVAGHEISFCVKGDDGCSCIVTDLSLDFHFVSALGTQGIHIEVLIRKIFN